MRNRRPTDPTFALLESPSPGMYAAVWTMGCLSGLLAGWAGTVVDAVWLNLPVAVWAFLVVWASSAAVLSYRRVPTGVVAAGLHIGAVFVVLVPVSVYGPRVLAVMQSGYFDGGSLSAELTALLTWGVVAGGVAALAVFVSNRLSRRVDRRRRRRLRAEFRRYE